MSKIITFSFQLARFDNYRYASQTIRGRIKAQNEIWARIAETIGDPKDSKTGKTQYQFQQIYIAAREPHTTMQAI